MITNDPKTAPFIQSKFRGDGSTSNRQLSWGSSHYPSTNNMKTKLPIPRKNKFVNMIPHFPFSHTSLNSLPSDQDPTVLIKRTKSPLISSRLRLSDPASVSVFSCCQNPQIFQLLIIGFPSKLFLQSADLKLNFPANLVVIDRNRNVT